MKRFTSLGMALLTLAAFGAVSATSASALENPEILPNPTVAAPVDFSSKGNGSTLLSPVGAISCVNVLNVGEFTSTRLGIVTVSFGGCKSAGVSCKTLSDAAGTILIMEADAHLVDVLPLGVLALGLAITPKANVVIKCGTLSVEVKGTVIGEIFGVTSGATIPVGTTKFVFFEPVGGKQEFTTCDLDKAFCEGKTYELSANFGTGFKAATEQLIDTITFEKAIAIDF